MSSCEPFLLRNDCGYFPLIFFLFVLWQNIFYSIPIVYRIVVCWQKSFSRFLNGSRIFCFTCLFTASFHLSYHVLISHTYMAVLLFLCETEFSLPSLFPGTIFTTWVMNFKSDNCNFYRLLATNSSKCTYCHGSQVWRVVSSSAYFFSSWSDGPFYSVVLCFVLVSITVVRTKWEYIISPFLVW